MQASGPLDMGIDLSEQHCLSYNINLISQESSSQWIYPATYQIVIISELLP